MSSSTFAGSPEAVAPGFCAAPPPPPPPPPVPGQMPSMRISTAEAPTTRRAQLGPDTGYEPPAAIQNAMLTKDKKPFTYTPGMGGKLDLSQIRSPRMARRVAKNANDEGIEGPPKSALESKPTTPQTAGASLFVQPQVAVPVFPTNTAPQTPVNRSPQVPILNRVPSNAAEKQSEPTTPKIVAKEEPKVAPIQINTVQQPSTPDSPGTPQVTLAKAPTPWLQNKNKQQEELPEWAKRASVNKTANSSAECTPSTQPAYATNEQIQQATPQWQQPQQRQQASQQQQQRQPPQQYQYQQYQPQSPQSPGQPYQQKRQVSSPTVQQQERQAINQQQQERVIPIRIEDRPSVFAVKQEPGHHQFKQPPSVHHQQRWGQTSPQNQVQQPQVFIPASPQPQQQAPGSYVIPIMVEGDDKRANVTPGNNVQQSNVRINPTRSEPAKIIVQQRGPTPVQEPGPVQSRSFRVLQKITDTDSNDVDTDQLRKLQLTEDDKILMNKFREQVDGENYLHQEEDPRYRGAAIPSRAFRFLQNMTDSGEISAAATTPRVQNVANKKQNRNSKSFEEMQANLPPSEQQVPEPKKYMGSAIPSRSFRILQAMTAPESVATQENRQADYTCQTENNVPGNQHGVFIPACPPPPPAPYWNPDGWWGYYQPLQYPTIPNPNDPNNPMKNIPFDPYVYRRYEDGNAYVFYPVYNQNYVPCDSNDREKNVGEADGYCYPGYVAHCQPPIHQINTKVESNSCPQAHSVSNKNSGIDSDDDKTRNVFADGQWRRMNDVSKVPISEKANDRLGTTTLNIVEEEEKRSIPKGVKSGQFDKTKISVPNYTYVDNSESDSSDSDSETSSSSSSSGKSSKSGNNDNTSNDTISESDSDSYLAYSTGLNPQKQSDANDENNTTDDKKLAEGGDEASCSENTISSSDSQDEEEEEEYRVESLKSDPITPAHRLSVIYEDTEHVEVEIPCPRKSNTEKWNNVAPCKATDDPPDEADTTVSVSLPLRFKFSVSENNEDVTTVIVGDSKIKSERTRNNFSTNFETSQQNRLIEEENTVDFTLKRPGSKVKSTEEKRIEVAEKVEDTTSVNFTLRKVPTKVNRVNCEENVETEFTVRSKKVDVTSHIRKEKRKLEGDKQKEKISKNDQDRPSSTSIENNNELTINNERCNERIVEPEIVVSECIWDNNNDDDDDKKPSRDTKIRKSEDSNDDQETNVSTRILSNDSNQRDEDQRYTDLEVDRGTKETKHLLSVQNSREETDDEDSGVTSDMSRMISEVDTDSECTSTKNLRKYQRTQTHSRLFRLLNDDSILAEDTTEPSSEVLGSSLKREYLSLPLKTHAFNYDENYCSNYSSGLTSPEYSPICEQSWKKIHEPEVDSTNRQLNQQQQQRSDKTLNKDDPYYQAWKSPKPNSNIENNQDHDVLPSIAFKILESKIPYWTYKVNVLCPRIKSTKSVPQALQGCKTNGSSGTTVLRSSPATATTLPLSYVENDHC